jgi:hypothetical protein
MDCPRIGLYMDRFVNKASWRDLIGRLGFLLAAALLAYVTWIFGTEGPNGFLYRTAVIQMSWSRGASAFGPDFIHLESPCATNSAPGCFCSNDFSVTRTKTFADYIESFGSSKVPVSYYVRYDASGHVSGAVLKSVGKWPADRLNVIERSIASGFRLTPNQQGRGVGGETPSDCFQKR